MQKYNSGENAIHSLRKQHAMNLTHGTGRLKDIDLLLYCSSNLYKCRKYPQDCTISDISSNDHGNEITILTPKNACITNELHVLSRAHTSGLLIKANPSSKTMLPDGNVIYVTLLEVGERERYIHIHTSANCFLTLCNITNGGTIP